MKNQPTYSQLLAENQRLKTENQRLRTEIQEVEIQAEQAEAEAHSDAAEQVKEQQKHTCFWAKCWWDVLFFYAKGAWEQVHALSAKMTHRDKLLSNPNVEPEERLVLQAYGELTIAPKHRDRMGRALVTRKDVMKLTGLSESTCYRVDKKLEAAGHIDAKVYYNVVKNRRDRFVKLATTVLEAPETLSTRAPKVEAEHPRCHECESDDTIIERKTIQKTTCRDCGAFSTIILPPRVIINPLYQTSKQDPASPGIMIPVNLTGIIKSGAKAAEGSSA